jgi:phospholipid transport system substrate-binding protein
MRACGRFIRFVFPILGAVFLLSQTVSGQPPGPREVIEEISHRLRTALLEDRERLLHDPGYVYRVTEGLLVPHIDMLRVSSLVLGRYWRQAEDGEKDAFVLEFKDLLVRTYSSALSEFGDWEVSFPPLRPQPDAKRVLVRSKVIRQGAQPVAVDYYMYLQGDRWLAYDVKIEGISLVTNYRSSFARLIRQKGIGGLIRELREKNHARASEVGKQVAANKGP